MNWGLPLRTRRKIKKVIEREQSYEKKKKKSHGTMQNAQTVH